MARFVETRSPPANLHRIYTAGPDFVTCPPSLCSKKKGTTSPLSDLHLFIRGTGARLHSNTFSSSTWPESELQHARRTVVFAVSYLYVCVVKLCWFNIKAVSKYWKGHPTVTRLTKFSLLMHKLSKRTVLRQVFGFVLTTKSSRVLMERVPPCSPPPAIWLCTLNCNGLISSHPPHLFSLCRSDWCLWPCSQCACCWCPSSCYWRGLLLSPHHWDAPSLSWSHRHGGGGVRMQPNVVLF